MATLFTISLLLAAVSGAPTLETRAEDTAVVHLGTSRGPSGHLASGFIYGIPDERGQIPSN